MKTKINNIFKIGLLIIPISFVTIATACNTKNPIISTQNPSNTAQIEKSNANIELAKVTLNFENKENVLASTIQQNSTFITDGFDKSKYDLQISNVEIQNDNRSIRITFHLNFKDSKVEPKTISDNRSLIITGFKEVITNSSPDTTNPVPESNNRPLEPNDPKILDITSKLQNFVSESLKNITPSDVIDSKNLSIEFFNSLLAEVNKSNPNIGFDTKKLELKITDKSLKFNTKIFDHIKNGLAHIFNINGGNIKLLEDVFMSKKNSIEPLLSSQPIEQFVKFLKPFAKFENDWKEVLISSLNSNKGFEFKLDFKNLEILAKTSENEYKKLITFDKSFFEAIKNSLSSILTTIFNKFVTTDGAPSILNSIIPALVEIVSKNIFVGSWIINHNENTGQVELNRPTLLTTTMNNA